MADPYRIEVPGHPPSPNDSLHPQKRRRLEKEMAEVVGWEARKMAPRMPHQYARVTVTFVCTRGPFRDEDNAIASIKRGVLDPLRKILIADDSMKHIALEVRQIRGKQRKTIIEVEPLEELP